MRMLWTTSMLVLLLAGCGQGTGAPIAGVETVVDTVEGVVSVRNSGTAPGWSAEPVLRLGSVAGGPQEFGRIRSVVADETGNIYVADNLAHEIRVFDPDGRHLRSIGREGEGPGEFGDLYSLAWLDGDLAAMDPRNARISLFAPDGVSNGSVRYAPITGPALLIRLHPLAQDGFYAPVIVPTRPMLSLARFTAEGVGDTLAPPQPPRRTGVLCHRSDGGITGISLPESPELVYAFPPRGGAIAVSWTEEYRIAFTDAQGDTVRIVSRARPHLPYPDSLWEEGMRPYRELLRDYPDTRCDPTAPERPRQRSALRHLMFDEAGRMWVEAATEEGFVWEVFDSDGRLLGAAPAPPRAPGLPPYVRDGYLYQVETDDLDVQYVAVYRVGPRG